jgi:hypothetical protein
MGQDSHTLGISDFPSVLEQVHVTKFLCRHSRLSWFAILGSAVVGSALSISALAAPSLQPTETSLSAQTHDRQGSTQATLSVTVLGQDGAPATGAIVIEDQGNPLAGAALDSRGQANLSISLPPGDHSLRALYQGDAAHQASASDLSVLRAQSGSTPDFTISVAPATATLTPGQSGNAVASVTPVNSSSLAAPMFVTLSCTGYPDQSSCTFTPENVEILPNATAAVTSSMVITTQAASTRGAAVHFSRPASHTVAWAILLPGALSLAGLAFSARRRRWLSRLLLLGLLALIATLGTTACAPLYNYYNHGPPYNLPTPAGSYTLTISAQSSNGVTATTHTTTFALTVK